MTDSAQTLTAGMPGYDEACGGYQLALRFEPAVVVRARTRDDVVEAVRFAASHGLSVQVQATGHGSGLRHHGGLLVDTSGMRSVTIDVDKRRAIAQAGARWQDVLDLATPYGLAPAVGSSPSVGLVGFTLGGGIGPLARRHGFAADHVHRIELVTADGSVVEATAESEPELFWALRGGKPDVGIVTEIEFDLLAVPDYYGGAVIFPGEAASDVLHAYAEWNPGLPEDATTSIGILRIPDVEFAPPPLRGKMVAHLRFVHLGSDDEGAALLAPMRQSGPVLMDMAARTPFAAIASVHQDPPDPIPGWDGGGLLHSLTPDTVDAFLAMVGPGVDTPVLLAEIRQMGGQIAVHPDPDNAVAGRDAAYSVFAAIMAPPPVLPSLIPGGRALLEAMRPWRLPGSLINFQGDRTEPADLAEVWAPAAAERLRRVKQEWDPDGRFRFNYPLG